MMDTGTRIPMIVVAVGQFLLICSIPGIVWYCSTWATILASRVSSVDVPYWQWARPVAEDAWALWDDPTGRDTHRRYQLPKDSRCQIFFAPYRRLVPISTLDTLTVARYERYWMTWFFPGYMNECASGTRIAFTPPQARLWLHALSGWGV